MVTAAKYTSWVEQHQKVLDSVLIQKEEDEKSLKAELASLKEKFERSQQELEGGDGSSSRLAADLSGKLSSANGELVRVRPEAEQYKENMEARYALLKRCKRALLINADREVQRQCNQVSRETANQITNENGLPTREFPNIFVPEDEPVEYGSSDEEEVSDIEQFSGEEETDVDSEGKLIEQDGQSEVNEVAVGDHQGESQIAGDMGPVLEMSHQEPVLSPKGDIPGASQTKIGGSSQTVSSSHDWAQF